MAISTPHAVAGLVPSARSLAELQLFRMPQGGTDRLRFETWDTFEVAGFPGPETVHLEGHYVIERADPTSPDWVAGAIEIRMRELAVEGVSGRFGRVRASLNAEIALPSGGQVRPGT